MAREVERAIPRGEGAGDPVFAPNVGINTPGLATTPQVDKFTQLQQVLFSGLGDLAQGLGGIGNAGEIIERKKEQVFAQQEQELAESRAEIERTRFERARGASRAILLDERSNNPEWVLQEAGTRLANASTEAEKELWFQLTMQAKGQVEQKEKNDELEAKRQKVEDLNLAGLTASRVIQTMEVQLQGDQALQADLIGNGEGIVQRVQDWVLSTVSDSDSDLFHLGEDASREEVMARDKIMGQLLSQSLGMADALTKQHLKQVDQAKMNYAVESLDALSLGIQKGQVTDPEVVDATLQYIDSNYMNHMTAAEKQEFKTQYINQAVKDAASLTYTDDVSKATQAMTTLISKSGLSPADQARAVQQASTILTRTVADKYATILDNEVASKTMVVPAGDGSSTTVQLPNTAPEQTLAQKDEFGVSLARRKAEELLTELGIGPERDDLSVQESAIRREILGAAAEIEAAGNRSSTAAMTLQMKGDQARQNLLTGDAKAMYETNPMFLARSPDGITARPDLVAAVEASGGQWGLDPAVPAGVGPVAMIPETRPAREAMMTTEARTWDKVSAFTFPDSMLDDMASRFKSKSSEDMYDIAVMFRELSLRKTEDFQQAMGKKLNMAESIALDLLRQASTNPDQRSWDAAFKDARNIMENPNLTPERLQQGARDSYGQLIAEQEEGMRETVRSKHGEALNLLLQSYQQDAGVEFTVFGETPDATSEFEEAFRQAGGFSDSNLDFLAARHEAFKGLGLSDVEAARANKAMLAKDGYKVAAMGDQVKIIRDPMNVLGYKPLTANTMRQQIQTYLNAPLKGEAFKNVVTKLNLKPGDPVPTTYWQAMKAADPARFGTMTPNDMAPTDWVLATDDSMWEIYAFRPPVGGVPQAVAMLRFKDVNGAFRPITSADGELASAYSQYLFEQVEPELKAKQAQLDASIQKIVDKYSGTMSYAARNSY